MTALAKDTAALPCLHFNARANVIIGIFASLNVVHVVHR